jgi:uncharacterized membrane protein
MRNLARWFFSNARSDLSRYMMGRAKAKVFPEPVLSRTMRSLPYRRALKVLYCTGKSDLTPFLISMSIVLGFLMYFSRRPGS